MARVPSVMAISYLLGILLLSTVMMVNGHECFHDKLKALPSYRPPEMMNVTYPVKTRADGRGFETQSTFDNIRVTVVWDADGNGHCSAAGDSVTTYSGSNVLCTADDVLTDLKRNYIVNTLMPKAAEWIESALRVVRVSGNLVVGGSAACGNNPGVTIPATDRSTGRADTDFLIYTTAVPMADSSSATVAWALGCRFDTNGRPVVGHVNWVPSRLTNAETGSSVTEAEDVSTGIHEIAHALGFSSPFFASNRGYLNTDGTTYTQGGISGPTADATLGKSVTKMVSPRVVAKAREYFGCDSLDGLEIEDQGGSGTAGSHWEKRIMYQEFMNGVGSNVATFKSAMSLAFFEDTGHYQANYGAVDNEMNWGKGKGCNFLNQKCDSTDNKASGEFCFETDNSKRLCTYDRLGIGMCDVASYTSSLQSHFQYFTDPTQGAQVQVGDFCPAVIPFSNTICIDPSTSDTQDIYGNDYGSSSRCYDSNLLDSAYSNSASSGARCFLTTCASSGALLLNIDGKTVQCPSDGSAGQANLDPLGLSFTGYINCPKADLICQPATPAPPPTPAPPTPVPTPLPPGATYEPAPITRAPPTNAPTLSPTCAGRVACADGLESWMPACRQVRDRLVDCFGTNCDDQILAWFKARGFDEDCLNRNTFEQQCQEGKLGVIEMCDLIGVSGAAPVSTVMLVLWTTVALVVVVMGL